MAQVFLRRKNVEQDGSTVTATFECTDEEQASRVFRSLEIGFIRGVIKFGVVIKDDK